MIEAPDLLNDPPRRRTDARTSGAAGCGVDLPDDRKRLKDKRGTHRTGRDGGRSEIVTEAEAALKSLVEVAAAKELEALLDGEADGNDTFLENQRGRGWHGIL